MKRLLLVLLLLSTPCYAAQRATLQDGSGNEIGTSGNPVKVSLSGTVTATAVTVADESTDTSCFPLFVTAATGDLAPKSGGGLTFNSNTDVLTSTGLVGSSSITNSALTATRVVFSGASGLQSDDADLTFATDTLTATKIAAFTSTGNITQNENVSIVLDAALSADGTYCGITEAGTAGAALAFGDIVYLAASDSRWELVDADASATAGPVKVGVVVLAAAGDGSATTILLRGKVRADANFPTMTISAPVYISTTTGDIQTTAPSGTDDVIRIMGHANTADELYFNPSPDFTTAI